MFTLRAILATPILVTVSVVHGFCQVDGLVPISPQEEQGRQVEIRFRSSDPAERQLQERLEQEEELPIPTPLLEGSPKSNESVDTSLAKNISPLLGEAIRQRYPDGTVQVLRYVRQDEFGNYFNSGPWKLFNRKGQVMAEGEFEDGLMQGTWTRWHPADADGVFRVPPFPENQGPFLSIATFHRGKLDGMWTIYDRTRRKLFEIQYVNGQRDGSAMWWNESGTLVREMRFESGLIHGEMIDYDSRQRPIKKTKYVKGRRVYSEVEHFRENVKKSEEYYLDAKLSPQGEDNWWEAEPVAYAREGEPVRHGPTKAWYENGQPRMEGNYLDNKRNGSFSWWHSNGQKQSSGQFRDDLKDGEWIWWHENGMKSVQGQFAENRPVGKWTWWDQDGKVLRSGEVDAQKMESIPAPVEGDDDDDESPVLSPPDMEPFEEIVPSLAAPGGG